MASDLKLQWIDLKGTSYYASLISPNKTFEPWEYSINLVLDEESVALAKKYKLNIKEAKDPMPSAWVKINRKISPDEVFSKKPELKYNKDTGYKEGDLIGNGSEVLVRGIVKDRTGPNGKHGVTLMKVKLLSYVPYASKNKDPFDDDSDESSFDHLNDELPESMKG